MGFIKDLYYGELFGIEDFGFNGSKEYRQLQAKKSEVIEKLEENFTDEQKELLKTLLETENQSVNIELFRMFEHAFRLGFSTTINLLHKSDC